MHVLKPLGEAAGPVKSRCVLYEYVKAFIAASGDFKQLPRILPLIVGNTVREAQVWTTMSDQASKYILWPENSILS